MIVWSRGRSLTDFQKILAAAESRSVIGNGSFTSGISAEGVVEDVTWSPARVSVQR